MGFARDVSPIIVLVRGRWADATAVIEWVRGAGMAVGPDVLTPDAVWGGAARRTTEVAVVRIAPCPDDEGRPPGTPASVLIIRVDGRTRRGMRPWSGLSLEAPRTRDAFVARLRALCPPTRPLPDRATAATALTRREQEIVDALRGAGRVRNVAHALGISPQTVRNHLKAIFRKLGISSQAELWPMPAARPVAVAGGARARHHR